MADTANSDGDPASRTQQSPLASQRAKQQGAPQTKRGYFPLGYKEGFSQWWANLSPAAAEHKVLSYLPYLQQPPTQMQTGKSAAPEPDSNPTDDLSKSVSHTEESSAADPYGPRKWHSSLIKLAGKNRAINEFSVERVGEDVDNNLVMLHGYGAGLGFFYRNFEPLSRVPNWRLYALDMLGMGRSSRPPFTVHAKDRQGRVTESENFFIDALEEWRKEKKIERMTLLGHSLGGYMAVAYALKYPGRINKLILASPVGIPEDPYAVSSDSPEPETSAMADEVMQDQAETTASGKGDNNNFLDARSKARADTSKDSAQPQRRPYPKWLTYLWDANVSPFSLVRLAGPLGPRLVSGWTSRRFSQMPPDEAQALHDYSYSLFRQRGSGEYALAYVLAPGAFARSPLIRRIAGVGRGEYNPADIGSFSGNGNGSSTATAKSNLEKAKERGIPIVFMYGEHDWMDVAGGYAAEQKLKEAKEAANRGLSAEEKQKDQGTAKVLIVKKAGHHVYLDGAEEFNDMIKKEMEDVEKRAKMAKKFEGR